MRWLLLLLLSSAFTFPQNIEEEIGLPLLLDVPTPPIPVPADGKYYLAYELHITNIGSKPLKLSRVEVSSAVRLAVLEGESLAACIKKADSGEEPLKLGSGRHALVFMWITANEVPQTLKHRIEGTEEEVTAPLSMESADLSISGTPVRLRPPLRGERWVAVNGPSNNSHHRRSWLPYQGRAIVPQRFAIDFIRVHEDGSPTAGDPKENGSHAAYGAEVFAVADSVVAAVKDGVPEQKPGEQASPPPRKLEEMGGNTIVLDLGGGRFAFYAHLQPGSLRVRKGERVHAGQALATVGNSGQSTAPHLHFQVGNGPTLLLSDGVPYVFDSFYHNRDPRKNEIPLRDWVVHFGK